MESSRLSAGSFARGSEYFKLDEQRRKGKGESEVLSTQFHAHTRGGVQRGASDGGGGQRSVVSLTRHSRLSPPTSTCDRLGAHESHLQDGPFPLTPCPQGQRHAPPDLPLDSLARLVGVPAVHQHVGRRLGRRRITRLPTAASVPEPVAAFEPAPSLARRVAAQSRGPGRRSVARPAQAVRRHVAAFQGQHGRTRCHHGREQGDNPPVSRGAFTLPSSATPPPSCLPPSTAGAAEVVTSRPGCRLLDPWSRHLQVCSRHGQGVAGAPLEPTRLVRGPTPTPPRRASGGSQRGNGQALTLRCSRALAGKPHSVRLSAPGRSTQPADTTTSRAARTPSSTTKASTTTARTTVRSFSPRDIRRGRCKLTRVARARSPRCVLARRQPFAPRRHLQAAP